MAFEIEKGIPLLSKPRADQNYPLRQMEVGDSFLVPCSDTDTAKVRSRFRGALHYAQKDGKRFATRAVEGGVRVWRLE